MSKNIKPPKDITIAITYRCNSRCLMCNIWKEKNPVDLDRKLLTKLNRDVKYINLTGGEPFLKEDFVEIIRLLHENYPKAQIVVNTNGFLTDLILKKTKEIMKFFDGFAIRISLDGGRVVHDKFRGIKGAYDKAITTLKELKKLMVIDQDGKKIEGVKNLGICFTLMNETADQLPKIYDLAQELKINFTISPVMESENYYGKTNIKLTDKEKLFANLDYIIKKELKKWNLKAWGKAFYTYGIKYLIENGKMLFSEKNYLQTAFVDPEGKVFPNLMTTKQMGDLNKNDLTKIWQEKSAKKIIKEYEEGKIEEGWIMCIARVKILKNWWKVLPWLLKNKLLNLF